MCLWFLFLFPFLCSLDRILLCWLEIVFICCYNIDINSDLVFVFSGLWCKMWLQGSCTSNWSGYLCCPHLRSWTRYRTKTTCRRLLLLLLLPLNQNSSSLFFFFFFFFRRTKNSSSFFFPHRRWWASKPTAVKPTTASRLRCSSSSWIQPETCL